MDQITRSWSKTGITISQASDKKGYWREYYKQFRGRKLINNHIHYENNKEHILLQSKNYKKQIRQELIDKLGGKCVRCDYNDNRALQIDHINGGGRQERLLLGNNSSKFYRKVIDNQNGYQLLCANCNQIKVVENNEYRKLGGGDN